MKLLNRTITCGGKLGCGHVFEFGEGGTVEFAAKTLREHRAEPDHMQRALDETNGRRLLRGEYALTMNELLGQEPKKQKPQPLFELANEVLRA